MNLPVAEKPRLYRLEPHVPVIVRIDNRRMYPVLYTGSLDVQTNPNLMP